MDCLFSKSESVKFLLLTLTTQNNLRMVSTRPNNITPSPILRTLTPSSIQNPLTRSTNYIPSPLSQYQYQPKSPELNTQAQHRLLDPLPPPTRDDFRINPIAASGDKYSDGDETEDDSEDDSDLDNGVIEPDENDHNASGDDDQSQLFQVPEQLYTNGMIFLLLLRLKSESTVSNLYFIEPGLRLNQELVRPNDGVIQVRN
jgi:hypothetical protein